MGRRRKCRLVEGMPAAVFYKPQGIGLGQLKGVSLQVDALEAMRLVDSLGLSQEEAAGRMSVSRPTLCRILAEGRKAVATALSNGWAIRIEGGDYILRDDARLCSRPGYSSPCRPVSEEDAWAANGKTRRQE